MPSRFIGKQVMVRAYRDSVALFFEDTGSPRTSAHAPGKRRKTRRPAVKVPS